jgi:RepB DNA-primase from phage plasmid
MAPRAIERVSTSFADRGLFLSLQGIRRQLAAMPHDLYLVRLIHQATRRAFPGERLWTAAELTKQSTVRFLRIRNREGCDIFIQPYAENQNAGYILLDLDHADPETLERMRANGHGPCVLLQTSPGHLQAWIRVSALPLKLSLARSIARELAYAYGGDLASTDGGHLGRLAGFTNQKPSRRQRNGYAPWVRVVYAQLGWATRGAALVEAAARQATTAPGPLMLPEWLSAVRTTEPVAPSHHCAEAQQIYRGWLHRLHILQRFPHPDGSIADKWIAKELLRRGASVAAVVILLREGSPGFPRGHGNPEDYLRRTLARALGELHGPAFPALHAPCVEYAAR